MFTYLLSVLSRNCRSMADQCADCDTVKEFFEPSSLILAGTCLSIRVVDWFVQFYSVLSLHYIFFSLFTVWIFLFLCSRKMSCESFFSSEEMLAERYKRKRKMSSCIFKTVFMFCGIKSLLKYFRCRYHRRFIDELNHVIQFWHKANYLRAKRSFLQSCLNKVLPFHSSSAGC